MIQLQVLENKFGFCVMQVVIPTCPDVLATAVSPSPQINTFLHLPFLRFTYKHRYKENFHHASLQVFYGDNIWVQGSAS